ncbi:MAG: HD domain-containing protein, partial [Pyrinomonadaceae bacterium]|nr:HD domain-containing protein [Pyrinomonadaceae bacterium]
MPATRMDQGTIDDWIAIRRAVGEWQSLMPERIKAMLLQLQEQAAGFGVSQLQHSLQTATRALRSGASEELIIAALCHDIGTAISVENHSAIAGEILKPYVSSDVYEIVRTHQDFQRAHYEATMGRDVEARNKYVNKSWFKLACRFSDEWDQTSFDPDYETLSIQYFEAMIERVFKPTRNGVTPSASGRRIGLTRAKDWIKR